MTTDVHCLLDARATLGECPVWSVEEQALYWVDTLGRSVNRFDHVTGANQSWRLPQDIGCCALREGGGLVLGLRGGFHGFDPGSGALVPLRAVEADRPDVRLNDGRCDRRGRFWAGSVQVPPVPARPGGALHRLDRDHRCDKVLDGLLIPNGLAFSPDDRTLYLSDSHPSRQTIWAFEFDADEGRLGDRRIFATTWDLPGRPDGAAVDAEGFYWSAGIDGGQVVRFAPDGRIDRTVALPVSGPTMCAFGGPGLDVLFVTSMRPADVDGKVEPLAGGLFAFAAGVAGLPEPRYAG